MVRKGFCGFFVPRPRAKRRFDTAQYVYSRRSDRCARSCKQFCISRFRKTGTRQGESLWPSTERDFLCVARNHAGRLRGGHRSNRATTKFSDSSPLLRVPRRVLPMTRRNAPTLPALDHLKLPILRPMCTAVLLRSSLTRKAHPRRPPFLRNLRKSWTPIRNCSRLGTRRGNRSPWFTLLQLRRMLKPSSTSSTVVSRRRGEGRRHVGRRLIGPRKS